MHRSRCLHRGCGLCQGLDLVRRLGLCCLLCLGQTTRQGNACQCHGRARTPQTFVFPAANPMSGVEGRWPRRGTCRLGQGIERRGGVFWVGGVWRACGSFHGSGRVTITMPIVPWFIVLSQALTPARLPLLPATRSVTGYLPMRSCAGVVVNARGSAPGGFETVPVGHFYVGQEETCLLLQPLVPRCAACRQVGGGVCFHMRTPVADVARCCHH